jgi:cation transport ATPase
MFLKFQLTLPIKIFITATLSLILFFGIKTKIISPQFQLLLSIPLLFLVRSDIFSKDNIFSSLGIITLFLYGFFLVFFPQHFLDNSPTFFDLLAFITTIILVGKFFENTLRKKTETIIEKLAGVFPVKVTVLKKGKTKTTSIKNLQKGDLVLCSQGKIIPVDGHIKSGFGYVDESIFFGLSSHQQKQKGDFVFAGTKNLLGTFVLKISQTGPEAIIQKILKNINHSQMTPENLKLKPTPYFIFVILIFVLFSFLLWYLFFGQPLHYAILTVVAILLIANSHAFKLAISTPLFTAQCFGVQNGIFFKEPQSLRIFPKTKTFFFKENGTLTLKQPKTNDLIPKKNTQKVIDFFLKKNKRLILLSNNNQSSLRLFAKILKIKEVLFNLTPLQIAERIKKIKLQNPKTIITFVSQSKKDTLPLKTADLSLNSVIDQNFSKSPTQIFLIKNDILLLPHSYKIAQKTAHIINQNLTFILLYHLFCLFLAAGFLSPFGIKIQPIFAATLGSLSSIFLILNSFRIKSLKLNF